MKQQIKIFTTPDQLTEGLFGQIFLHVFEILPYLDKNSIAPKWLIRSKKYGIPEDYVVIPGCVDINCEAANDGAREINIQHLRDLFAVSLGNDWAYISGLWSKYFRWPQRVVSQADQFPVSGQTLGLHYRGTDKNFDTIQTNPVSADSFIVLVKDFLLAHPDVQNIFLATDENTFIARIQAEIKSVKIFNSGEVAFWKNETKDVNFQKSDHAMLDCLLLSRCKYLIKCQSALSGFAKILNPQLEAYRVAASKPFYYGIPYFPDAYIPKLTSNNEDCQKLLNKLFEGDWTLDRVAAREYGGVFKYKSRKGYVRKDLRIKRWSWDWFQFQFDKRFINV